MNEPECHCLDCDTEVAFERFLTIPCDKHNDLACERCAEDELVSE
jgi:hypothetical protein